jgi:N-acetylglutamate synthase-like GNAT family acetyltransferase
MEIRRYRRNDQDACLAIFESNVPDYFHPRDRADLMAFLDDLPGPYFVCVAPGRGVVACGGYYTQAEAQLAALTWGMVHRDLHRQGIGRTLLEFRLAEIRAIPQIRTVRARTTQITEDFFRRCGFVEAARRADGFGPGLDLVELELQLPRDCPK